jgi:hypothetical protein
MVRRFWLVLSLLGAAWAQERRPRIDVENYLIEAEITPTTQTLAAKVRVRFLPQDDGATAAVFELNSALNLSKVEDEAGELPGTPGQGCSGDHHLPLRGAARGP